MMFQFLSEEFQLPPNKHVQETRELMTEIFRGYLECAQNNV